MYSPVSGEVISINEDLADSPGKVNDSAYTDGWMMKVGRCSLTLSSPS